MTANKAFGELRQQADATVTSIGAVNRHVEQTVARIDAMENRERAPPPPPPPPHGGMDLNLALGSSSHHSAMDGERPLDPECR